MKKGCMFIGVVLLMIVAGCSGSGSDPLPVNLSSAKAMTAFSLNGVAATIDETAKTISVTMPFGTDVKHLVATFETTGKSVKVGSTVQESGTTSNDFTNPVVYTVTAENNSTQDYTVTVTVEAADYTSPNIGTLKYVPAGSFQRDATATNISVISKPFRMSQYEITRAQFLAVMGTDPSNTTYSTGTSDPVQTVNWYHAIAFCNKLSLLEGFTLVYSVTGVNFSTLTYAEIPTGADANWNAVTADWSANGYRLPTEMEWMWAAMGATSALGYTPPTYVTGYAKSFAGSNSTNATGDNGTNFKRDYAWTSIMGEEEAVWSYYKTHPVGTKLANELDLYDMIGNVSEWCWDWYGDYPDGTQTDYRGAASGLGHVIRGGSWNVDSCVSCRWYNPQNVQYTNLGFRVVRP